MFVGYKGSTTKVPPLALLESARSPVTPTVLPDTFHMIIKVMENKTVLTI